MSIANYMHPDAVLFLKAQSRNEALEEMVTTLNRNGLLSYPELFLSAITEREKIVSTGVGRGIAIPHAKLAQYDNFFIAVGILQNPIDWNSLDGAPVRAIFLIGGPDDKQTEYLQILSNLTRAVKDEERRKKILKSEKTQDIIDIFIDI